MKIIIIGGVAGGASTATRLRRLDEKANIVLFEKGEYLSYANCGLPYYIGDTIKERDMLFVQTPEGFKNRFNIDVRTLQEVVDIDSENKTITVKNLKSGESYTETYDKLVLSPGAEPIRPPVKGIDSKKVFTLRTVPDTDNIKAYVTNNKIKSAVVVGGGFIGLEMVENLHQLGIDVTVVERADQVMGPIDFSMASIVHHHLVDKGVKLLLNEGVSGFDETEKGINVELLNGKVLETDMVIWSIGVRPDVRLAQKAGLTIGVTGGIFVNEYLQTSNTDIYAVGDAIEVINPVTTKQALVPLAGPANKQGRIVAANIVDGNKQKYNGSIGTAIAKVFDLAVASTGASAKLLKREGISYLSSYTHPSSHAGYYPNSLPMSIKIVFSPDTGQLLGAQIVGCDGVDKRIEMLAQVVQHKGTIYDLCELEHAYAPPYASAKDPVNMAGFVAANILTKKVKIVQWRDLKSEDVLIDVRTEEEFELGHIKGAVNLPLDSLRQNLNKVPKDRKVVVYCAVGLRGYLSYRILVQSGFDNVFSLSGGYKTYQAATAEIDQTIDTCQMYDVSEQSPLIHEHFIEVDACGLQCPGPVIKLKETYSLLKSGQQMLIKATDPAFKKDLTSWCNVTGAKLLSIDSNAGVFTAVIQKEEKVEDPVTKLKKADRKTIIVFSDDLDKALASFVIANGAVAMGKEVSMFFTFWGLNVIKKIDKPAVKKDFFGKMFGFMLPANSKKLSLSKLNMWGMGRWMMRLIMKKKNIESLEQLIEQAKSSGVEFIACTMSMDVMGVKHEELMDGVTLGGVAAYLERAEESNMGLFI